MNRDASQFITKPFPFFSPSFLQLEREATVWAQDYFAMRREERHGAGFRALCGACGPSTVSLCPRCRRCRGSFADHRDGARRVGGRAEHESESWSMFGDK